MKKLASLFFGLMLAFTVSSMLAVAHAEGNGPPEPPDGSVECPPSTHDDGTGTCVPNGGGVGNCGQNEGDNGNGTGGDNGYGNGDECGTTTTTVVTVPPTTTAAPTTTVTEPPETTTTTATEAPPTTTGPTGPTTPPAEPKPHSPKHTHGAGKTAPDKKPSGKLAFTGIEDIVPIGSIALLLLSLGSGLLWLGRKRDDS